MCRGKGKLPIFNLRFLTLSKPFCLSFPIFQWQLASVCLNFFLKLASKYELDATHFKKSSLTNELVCDHSAGGHLIISNMLQDSLLLKTVNINLLKHTQFMRWAKKANWIFD